MIRRPPRSTRTDTLFPYTTLFRSTVSPVLGPYGKQKVNGSSIFPKRLAGAVVDPAIGGALAMEQVDHLVFRQSGAVEQAGMAADRGAVGAPLDHADQGLVALLAEQALAASSEEHTSELQSRMRISYAVSCL